MHYFRCPSPPFALARTKRSRLPLQVRMCAPAIAAAVLLALGNCGAEAQVLGVDSRVVWQGFSIEPGQNLQVRVDCDPGETATGGGVAGRHQSVYVISSEPYWAAQTSPGRSSTPPTGWEGWFRVRSDVTLPTSHGVAVFAVCASPNPHLTVTPSGNVGIGTPMPGAPLHVLSSGDGSDLLLDNRGTSGRGSHISFFKDGAPYGAVGMTGKIEGDSSTDIGLFAEGGNGLRFYVNGSAAEVVKIEASGRVGIGTPNPQGTLDVNGTIFQRGASLHADYVFRPDYALESIEDHAEFMWANRRLKAMPKAELDEDGQEMIEVGAQHRGTLEELEKAHIYIQQLHKHMKTLEKRVAQLEAGPNGAQ